MRSATMPTATPTSAADILHVEKNPFDDDVDGQTTLWTKLAMEKERQEQVRNKYLSCGAGPSNLSPRSGLESFGTSTATTAADPPSESSLSVIRSHGRLKHKKDSRANHHRKGETNDNASSPSRFTTTSDRENRSTAPTMESTVRSSEAEHDQATPHGNLVSKVSVLRHESNPTLVSTLTDVETDPTTITNAPAVAKKRVSRSKGKPENDAGVKNAVLEAAAGGCAADVEANPGGKDNGSSSTDDRNCKSPEDITELHPHQTINYLEKGDTNDVSPVGGAAADADVRPSMEGYSAGSHQMVWGSPRVIKEEEVKERECWVYFVAAFLIVATTLGLGCVVFLAFGAAGEQVDYEESLLNIVRYLSPNPSVFDYPSSPESLALDWLANVDAAQVDPDDRVRVENRYSLAVLFFATDGTSQWVDSLNFLAPENECAWNVGSKGVFCESQNIVSDLILESNNLRGSIPAELTGLSSLKVLNFNDNRLTGTIPSLQYTLLESLLVCTNSLEGSIPSSLQHMSGLLHLDLSVNMLTATVPRGMAQLTRLERFHVARNKLSGTVGEALFSLTNLRQLNVTINKFDDSLDFLRALPTLEILDLSWNLFRGPLPEDAIAAMTNLEALVLSHNFIVGSIPITIGSLARLSNLEISTNLLTGTFPWISFPENAPLAILDLSDNVLTGQIPGDIFRFSNLEVVDFGTNHLVSIIPLGIGSLVYLQGLLLGGNTLTGSLPASLGTLQSLITLDVSDNELAGNLPDTLGNLQLLQTLDLHGNQFLGSVPGSIGNLDHVIRIVLQENTFTGNINFLCLLPSKPIISADCAGTPPQVLCDCCQICVQ